MSDQAADPTAPKEWKSILDWEERRAVVERTFLKQHHPYMRFGRVLDSPEDAAGQILGDPLTQRLSLQEFTELAKHLRGELSWSGFLSTWERLEATLNRRVEAKQAVEQCLAECFQHVGSDHGLDLYAVDDVRQHLDEFPAWRNYVALAEAFDVVEPHEVDLTSEENRRWLRVSVTDRNY